MVAILDFFGLQIIGVPCRYVALAIAKSIATHSLWDICKEMILILEMLKVLELAHLDPKMEIAYVYCVKVVKIIQVTLVLISVKWKMAEFLFN